MPGFLSVKKNPVTAVVVPPAVGIELEFYCTGGSRKSIFSTIMEAGEVDTSFQVRLSKDYPCGRIKVWVKDSFTKKVIIPPGAIISLQQKSRYRPLRLYWIKNEEQRRYFDHYNLFDLKSSNQ